MNGNELDLKTFLEEYESEDLEDKSIEVVNLSDDTITELSQEEFKDWLSRKESD